MENNTEICIGVLKSYVEEPYMIRGRKYGKDVTFTFITDGDKTFSKSFHVCDFGNNYDANYIRPIIEQTAYMLGLEPTLQALNFESFVGESFILVLNTRESKRGLFFQNVVGCIPMTDELGACFD